MSGNLLQLHTGYLRAARSLTCDAEIEPEDVEELSG